ncbi:MAG TPA: PA0069 family radical SAM protein, partial [bacterium]|nr:PA0069 family radical SAM protein [bacterium]
ETGPEYASRKVRTEYFVDHSREVLTRNDSPDLPFEYSLNPYRGCEHGCSYCYARPYHEFLGLSAGLDFETKIFAKLDAPVLLEKRLCSRGWQAQGIAMSGVTDCYQPLERQLCLTRRCLEVFLGFKHPVEIITKNALILRDLDLLAELARLRLVRVSISVTTLDAALCRAMEPRAVSPARRLEAIRQLSAAGVPTGVNVAPVIPGLTEQEMPAILAAAASHGAYAAGYIVLRLPYAVKEVFLAWLQEHAPHKAARVRHGIEAMRAGALNDPRFGSRMKGEGVRADLLAQLFRVHCQRLGLRTERTPLATEHFRPADAAQGELFGSG